LINIEALKINHDEFEARPVQRANHKNQKPNQIAHLLTLSRTSSRPIDVSHSLAPG